MRNSKFWSCAPVLRLGKRRSVIAEHLSARQLILYRMSVSVIMYLSCFGMQFKHGRLVQMGYAACTGTRLQARANPHRLGGPFVSCSGSHVLELLAWTKKMMDVMLCYTRSRQLTKLENSLNSASNFCCFAIFLSSNTKDYVVWKRHIPWWPWPQMYNIVLLSTHAWGLLYIFITLVITRT